MEINTLKELCVDKNEQKYISIVYAQGLKGHKPFFVSFEGKNRKGFIQHFNQHGIPIGKLISSNLEDLYF